MRRRWCWAASTSPASAAAASRSRVRATARIKGGARARRRHRRRAGGDEVPAAYLDELLFVAEDDVRDADALGDGPVRRPLEFQPRWEALPTHLNRATGSRSVDVALRTWGGSRCTSRRAPSCGERGRSRARRRGRSRRSKSLATRRRWRRRAARRSYDVDAIMIALAARDEEPPADGAARPRRLARRPRRSSARSGARRPATASPTQCSATTSSGSAREVFGGEDDADDWLR